MNKLWQTYAWATITAGFVLFGLIAFWLFYPYKTLTFNDKAFPILTPKVKQGGVLQYTSSYCKYTNLKATLARVFVDDIIYSTPITTTDRDSGCHSVVIGVLIPSELPVGTYILDNTYTYQVNPIRNIVIEMKTDPFVVIEK